jgi:hypothetical protein
VPPRDSVFVNFDGMTDRIVHDPLRAKGVTFVAAGGLVELYHGGHQRPP